MALLNSSADERTEKTQKRNTKQMVRAAVILRVNRIPFSSAADSDFPPALRQSSRIVPSCQDEKETIPLVATDHLAAATRVFVMEHSHVSALAADSSDFT